MPQCYGCKFFARDNERGGHCHRYPPQIICEVGTQAINNQAQQYFPYMENTDWCGEHQPR